MKFSIIMLLVLYPIRKIGWIISPFLYKASNAICITILFTWGLGVGFWVGVLDWNLNPNIVLKIIFGFFEGLYLASPNFGLLDESTVPFDIKKRHKLISHLPQFVFAIIALILFYMNTVMSSQTFTVK